MQKFTLHVVEFRFPPQLSSAGTGLELGSKSESVNENKPLRTTQWSGIPTSQSCFPFYPENRENRRRIWKIMQFGNVLWKPMENKIKPGKIYFG